MQKINVSETYYCFLFFNYIKESTRFDYMYLLKIVYLYNVTFPENNAVVRSQMKNIFNILRIKSETGKNM